MPSKLPMWKSLQMSLKACLLLASKVWTFVAFLFKKQYKTVSLSLTEIVGMN